MVELQAATVAYSGHLRQARLLLGTSRGVVNSIPGADFTAANEAALAFLEAYLGDRQRAMLYSVAALQHSKNRNSEYLATYALGLAQNTTHLKEVADDLNKRFPQDTRIQDEQVPTLRALLALNRKRPEEAIQLLQVAKPAEFGSYPDSIYVRGMAFLALRRGDEAAQEFKRILDHRGIVMNDPSGALALLELGRAYVQSGDRMKAKDAYESFLGLWKDADTDLLIFKQAKTEYSNLK
jgi:tetratricopeptide (TPR) repeat protein